MPGSCATTTSTRPASDRTQSANSRRWRSVIVAPRSRYPWLPRRTLGDGYPAILSPATRRTRLPSTITPARRSRRTRVSESWLPATNATGLPIRATRAVSAASNGEPRSVRSPANTSGPPSTARSSAGRASRLLCRSDARVRRSRRVAGPRSPGAAISLARPTSWASSSSEIVSAESCALSIARSAAGMSGPLA